MVNKSNNEKNKCPAFQFYCKDWLSSPKIAMMTPAEEGAYLRLLCYCWDDIDCSIPNDSLMLARLSRLHDFWTNSEQIILSCFVDHPTKIGYLTNMRLQKELQKQKNWRKKCSEAGKMSAAKRKETYRDSNVSSTNVEQENSRLVQLKGNIAVCSLQSADKDLCSELDQANIKHPDLKTIGSAKKKIARVKSFDDTHFEKFWSSYHPTGRVHKKKCRDIWKSNNLDDCREEIFSHVKNLLNSHNWKNNQYILHVERYLKQERWKATLPTDKPRQILTDVQQKRSDMDDMWSNIHDRIFGVNETGEVKNEKIITGVD